MKAIILAAGRGSRMRNLTADAPKCFISLAGRRLFDWQLGALKEAGVNEIGVVAGYKREAFDPYKMPIFCNSRWEQTNMVRSLMCADAWLRETPCVVSYSDIVYHPRIVRGLAAAAGKLCITYDTRWLELWSQRFADPLADAETFKTDETGRIVEIGNRPSRLEDVKGQYMGLLKFTPEAWTRVAEFLSQMPDPDVDKLDMTGLLRRLAAAGNTISTVPANGAWCEADNENDLAMYEKKIADAEKSKQAWSHDWRWSRA